EDGDGVYRLSDLQRIIGIEPMRYEFTYGSLDTEIEIIRLITGRVTFSDDSQYAAITGAGVYRLSDGQKVVDTSGYPLLHSGVFDMEFSPDNSMVATGFGIYRLSDGQMLGSSLGSLPHFSADSAYVWLSYVYRLSDGVRLFEVNSPHFVNFSPNMQYAAVLRNGVFQLSDGQRLYALPEFSPEFSHAVFSADSQYMITPDGVYVVATGEKIFNDESTFGMDALFTPDGSHLAIRQDGLYRLSDRVKLFAIGGGAEQFNFDGTYLVSDGVYRTADGQKIIEAGGLATFSSDGQYVAMSGDGLYRLSDGQEMFDIVGSVRSFTDDGAYINVGYSSPEDEFAIYRVLDGERYPGLRILNLSTGLLAVGNTALVIDPTQ
ncbi:MAG: hypothetical protein H7175_14830, partial [Burkholderiales bacterium]|nr:hypothetical protein [Anaerolineae bacterium]